MKNLVPERKTVALKIMVSAKGWGMLRAARRRFPESRNHRVLVAQIPFISRIEILL
jgi:hypothetical protein